MSEEPKVSDTLSDLILIWLVHGTWFFWTLATILTTFKLLGYISVPWWIVVWAALVPIVSAAALVLYVTVWVAAIVIRENLTK